MSASPEALLRDEFSKLTVANASQLKGVDAIVVFCAEDTEVIGENGDRIKKAIELSKQTGSDIIFLGTIYHIKYLEEYLHDNKIMVKVIYPTRRRSESSWTEARGLADFLESSPREKILVLSSAYHIPRLKRYCAKYLPAQKKEYYPVGDLETQVPQIEDEISKIVRYAAKGDLYLTA